MKSSLWVVGILLTLAMGTILVVAPPVRAWNMVDLACGAAADPGMDPNDDASMEKWLDWWSECAAKHDGEPADIPGGGGGFDPPPPPCLPHTFKDSNGRCWRMVCTDEGPEIRPCFDGDNYMSRNSRIFAIKLGRNGYTVLTGRKGVVKSQYVPANQVNLTGLARAMIAGSVLPTADLVKIPAGYWEARPAFSLKVTTRKANPGSTPDGTTK